MHRKAEEQFDKSAANSILYLLVALAIGAIAVFVGLAMIHG